MFLVVMLASVDSDETSVDEAIQTIRERSEAAGSCDVIRAPQGHIVMGNLAHDGQPYAENWIDTRTR